MFTVYAVTHQLGTVSQCTFTTRLSTMSMFHKLNTVELLAATPD